MIKTYISNTNTTYWNGNTNSMHWLAQKGEEFSVRNQESQKLAESLGFEEIGEKELAMIAEADNPTIIEEKVEVKPEIFPSKSIEKRVKAQRKSKARRKL